MDVKEVAPSDQESDIEASSTCNSDYGGLERARAPSQRNEMSHDQFLAEIDNDDLRLLKNAKIRPSWIVFRQQELQRLIAFTHEVSRHTKLVFGEFRQISRIMTTLSRTLSQPLSLLCKEKRRKWPSSSSLSDVEFRMGIITCCGTLASLFTLLLKRQTERTKVLSFLLSKETSEPARLLTWDADLELARYQAALIRTLTTFKLLFNPTERGQLKRDWKYSLAPGMRATRWPRVVLVQHTPLRFLRRTPLISCL